MFVRGELAGRRVLGAPASHSGTTPLAGLWTVPSSTDSIIFPGMAPALGQPQDLGHQPRPTVRKPNPSGRTAVALEDLGPSPSRAEGSPPSTTWAHAERRHHKAILSWREDCSSVGWGFSAFLPGLPVAAPAPGDLIGVSEARRGFPSRERTLGRPKGPCVSGRGEGRGAP